MDEPESVEKMESHIEPHQNPNEPEQGREKGKAPIHRFENHVKRCKQDDNACAVSEIAGNTDAKEAFVSEYVLRGLLDVALDDQTVVDREIDVDHNRKCDEVSPTRRFCGHALRLVDGAERHFFHFQAAERQIALGKLGEGAV